jgi:hypothetical protein
VTKAGRGAGWQGGVSLAQSYEALFKHRMRNSDNMTELNNQLMSAVKAQDVRAVVEVLPHAPLL